MRSVERAVTAALKVMCFIVTAAFLSSPTRIQKQEEDFGPVIFEMADNNYQPMERSRLREALINS